MSWQKFSEKKHKRKDYTFKTHANFQPPHYTFYNFFLVFFNYQAVPSLIAETSIFLMKLTHENMCEIFISHQCQLAQR